MTIDAMGTHASSAQAIVDKEADYVLALKGNQPRLFSEVQALFADAMAVGFRGVEHRMNRQVDGGHGRVEIRQAWVITDPAHVHYLDPEGTWPNLRSIALVRAERRCGDQVSHEMRYYLSSLAGPRVPPELYAQYAWTGRTIEFHRAQIRQVLGFREATVQDADDLATWLCQEVLAHEYRPERLQAAVYARCRACHLSSRRPLVASTASSGRRSAPTKTACSSGCSRRSARPDWRRSMRCSCQPMSPRSRPRPRARTSVIPGA